MGRTLTARQQRVYDYIHERISNRGYGPTVREIGEFLGIKSPNGVICHLRALERKGMISRAANKSRAIELKNRSNVHDGWRQASSGTGSCSLFDRSQTPDVLSVLQQPDRTLVQYHGDDLRRWAIADGDILVVEQTAVPASESMMLLREPSGKLVVRPPACNGTATTTPSRLSIELAPDGEVVGAVVGILRAFPSAPKAAPKPAPLAAAAGVGLAVHASHEPLPSPHLDRAPRATPSEK